jgi:nucleotide-binding universal stress UspA family protein
MRVLVGLDGGDGGRDALELARVLTSGSQGSVLAIVVLGGGPLPMEYALLDEEEARQAEPLFEEARAALGEIPLETRAFGGGSPAAILTTLAEKEDIDAVVVGSPHRGAVGQVMIGSVAKSLLNGAPCEVFVAPKGYAREQHDPFRAIAIGYDGSPEAKEALRCAEELARPSNAMLRILTVVSPPAAIPAPGALGVSMPQSPADPDRVINEAVNSVDSSLGAEGRRLDGAPRREIAGACEDGVDLLALGSRGYGPLARVLLGSVSRALVDDVNCPVVVVPRP